MDCRQFDDPSEVEAWKTMLDSMIKFINASTKLMNTYNQRASNQIAPACVPECPTAPKTTVRQCSANVSRKQSTSAKAALQPTAKNYTDVNPTITENTIVPVPDNPQENVIEVQVKNEVPSTSIPETESEAVEEVEKAGDESETAVEVPVENQTTVEGPGGNQTVEVPVGNQTVEVPVGNQTVEVPVGNQTTVEDMRKGGIPSTTTNEKSSKAAEGVENAGGDICVCKDLREVKPDAKDSAAKKCGCGAKKSKPQLCACPVTSKETNDLTESMVQKLEKAQGEIDGLKNELQKLQYMESTRKSNSAALYKEIMKETSLDPRPTCRTSATVRRTTAPRAVSNLSPPAYNPLQTGRLPSAIPPSIRLNDNTLSLSQAPDTRSYPQSSFRGSPVVASIPKNHQRTSPMMQPLAASSFIGDVAPISSASRWPQQIPNRQIPDLASQSLNTAYYIDDGPTQTGTSQRWNDGGYYPEFNTTSDASRFPHAANPTSVYPNVQYSEVECVFRRPKNSSQESKITRTSPQIASEFHPVIQEQMRAIVCAPPRTYARSPVYQNPRYAYENEEQYDDQLCDDYTCENDECEDR